LKPNGSVEHEVSSCNQRIDPVGCRRVASLMPGEALKRDNGAIFGSIGMNRMAIRAETAASFVDREQSRSRD
jgi:hypothetical protein